MKAGLRLLIKIAVLTVLLFIIFGFSGAILGMGEAQESSDPGSAIYLLLVCLLYSAVLSYPIIRSRWSGWRLVLAVFVVFYGVMTFLSQIETVVFLNYLVDVVPAAMIPKLFLQGLIIAVLFSPLAVLIHGKAGGGREAQQGGPNPRLILPWSEWLWKLAVIAAAYLFIYIFFGRFVFIPLAGEAYEQYYAGLQMPPWILPFQVLRALLWIALALPVIRMMKGRWWETGLAVSLLFAVLMGALLLIPQPYMPEQIRLAHFVELIISNFLFGWIVVLLLHCRQRWGCGDKTGIFF